MDRPSGGTSVVLHIDIDSFYVQAEYVRRPELRNEPVAVSQHNRGGFVAVNERAKAQGIQKGDGIGTYGHQQLSFYRTRPEATMTHVLRKCPNLVVLEMDSGFYRLVTAKILRTIQGSVPRGSVVEKRSVDDFYVLLPYPLSSSLSTSSSLDSLPSSSISSVSTPSAAISSSYAVSPSAPIPPSSSFAVTRIAGTDEVVLHSQVPHSLLSTASQIAAHIRQSIFTALNGMTCSCGIGANKLQARLCSPILKPNGQTVLLPSYVPWLLSSTPVRHVPGLKRLLGDQLERKVKEWKLVKEGGKTVENGTGGSDSGFAAICDEKGLEGSGEVWTEGKYEEESDELQEAESLHLELDQEHSSASPSSTPILLSDLSSIPLPTLVSWFGPKQGKWVWEIARGDDSTIVKPFVPPQSIICERSFNPIRHQQSGSSNAVSSSMRPLLPSFAPTSYSSSIQSPSSSSYPPTLPVPSPPGSALSQLQDWLSFLSLQLLQRLEHDALEFQRVPHKLSLHWRFFYDRYQNSANPGDLGSQNPKNPTQGFSMSRSCPMPSPVVQVLSSLVRSTASLSSISSSSSSSSTSSAPTSAPSSTSSITSSTPVPSTLASLKSTSSVTVVSSSSSGIADSANIPSTNPPEPSSKSAVKVTSSSPFAIPSADGDAVADGNPPTVETSTSTKSTTVTAPSPASSKKRTVKSSSSQMPSN
eukprot:GILI01009772.1.p1 GENE.GILI01009772.1~~GILI01009772.1.p1  ORF type:complete len:699 (+),score=98.73 GILI01009772.1:96-2192(+)